MPPLRRLARSAPSATALDRRGPRGGTEPVRERDPDAVQVLDDVEPVAGDLVAGQHVARDLAARDARDARRQQALLDLRRGARLLAPLPARERVGVAIGEGDRRRRLTRDLGQRPPRASQRQQHADRPPAQPERHDLDPPPVGELGPQLGRAPPSRARARSPAAPRSAAGDARGPRRAAGASRRCRGRTGPAGRPRSVGPRPRAARAAPAGRRRRTRGCPRARPAGRDPAARAAGGAPPSRPRPEAPRSGRRRRGRRGRGSGGRASSVTRRPRPRYRPSVPRATARAGGGSPRRSSAGSGACPRGRHPRSSLGGSAGGGQDMRPIVPRFCPMSRVRQPNSGRVGGTPSSRGTHRARAIWETPRGRTEEHVRSREHLPRARSTPPPTADGTGRERQVRPWR